MSDLGRSLVFTFKYWDEMHALYLDPEEWNEDNILYSEMDHATYEKLEAVAERAEVRAKDFLKDAGERLSAMMDGFCKTSLVKYTANTTYWRCEVRLWPRGKRKPGQNYKASLGFTLGAERPEYLAWVWSQGGRAREDELYALFRQSGRFEGLKNSQYDGSTSGNLFLETWPLLAEGHEGFELDYEEFMERCLDPFKKLDDALVSELLAKY